MRRELPSIFRPGPITAFLLALLALPLLSCLEPLSVTCPSGRVCPVGQKCAAHEDVCIVANGAAFCGDGIIQPGETCDDGNTTDGDGCNKTCGSNEYCGNGIVDLSIGEKCDDGNTEAGDGCSADCRSGEQCSNGIRDPDEECDDGNSSDEDNCLTTCKLATCGDGFIDRELPRTEECDGAGESETCNANCTARACGDGIVNVRAGEQCDSGAKDANGQPSPKDSSTCDFDCTIAICGDGHMNQAAEEACDDGNADSCGTCDAICKAQKPQQAATGTIVVASPININDGEVFSISDDHLNLIFEFDNNNFTPLTHIAVKYEDGDSNKEIASSIRATIEGAIEKGLNVWVQQLESDKKTIRITNKEYGSFGNHPIIETVGDDNFKVHGLSEGSGHDCPPEVGCTKDQDCQHGLTCRPLPDQSRKSCQP